MRLLFVAVALLLSGGTQAQGYGPTVLDITAAYCLGVQNEDDRTMRVLLRMVCQQATGAEACSEELPAESIQRRRRIAGYLVGRGYGGATTMPGEDGILASARRGEQDAAACGTAIGASCLHCVRGSAASDATCAQRCGAQFPACRDARRCEDPNFLRSVP